MALHLLHWLRRAARSRGHGVHSPFAYRFITEALHCPKGCRYYAESELEQLPPAVRRSAVLALRIHAHLPSLPVVASGVSRDSLEALTVALPGLTPVDTLPERPALLIMGRDCTLDPLPLLDAGGAVQICHADLPGVRHLRAGMKRGMTFASRDHLVAVGLHHLPRQDFDLNF